MLICIVGQKRSGKDTVASMLEDKIKACPRALAGQFKSMIPISLSAMSIMKPDGTLYTTDDINGSTEYNRESDMLINDETAKKLLCMIWENVWMYSGHDLQPGYDCINEFVDMNSNQPWSIRRIMQVIGTDVGVYLDTYIWVDFFFSLMGYLQEVHASFQPEPFVGVMTDCRQKHEIAAARGRHAFVVHIHRDTGIKDDHVTEQGLEPLPGEYHLYNNGTLEDLEAEVDKMIEVFNETKRNW